ncbi:MAG TPA: VWA domain-containing protein [Kofleriaceae bacterium]|nr:VWA domain-containing protein [Kofleriaceae bacterium]
MTPDGRKTAVILCAAGALIAAAIFLQRSAASGAPAPGPTARPEPAATPPATPAPTPASCDAPSGATARVSAGLGHGRAAAALSAGKILRGAGGQLHAAFDLAADPAPAGARQPLDLALVIDRSGSMEGDKLEHARAAAIALIGRLDQRDRIALIQYDDDAQVVVPSVAADSEGKQRLLSAVRQLTPGGSTNLHGGMTLGRDEVLRTLAPGQVSRVILLSDGLANAGQSDPVVIADTARMAADRGVRITAVGVGLEYNEDLMEAIAESGRGNYYYVREAAGLDGVLAGELSAAQATVASEVELRLRPACTGVEIGEVSGYESRREGDAVVIKMADLFGGDSRRLVVSLKVPDRVAGRQGALVGELRYRDRASGEAKTVALPLAVEVTDDRHAADDSVDRDVMAQVLKAQSAQSMRQAARAYQQGDATGAAALLRKAHEEVKTEGGRYGIEADVLEPALGEMDGFAAQVQAAPAASEAGKAAMKRGKSVARDLAKGK